MSHVVTWDAGATADIEFISPEVGATKYRLRYNPPHRTTLRSPVESMPVGPLELANSRQKLQQFAESIHLVGARGAPGGPAGAAPDPVTQLQNIGRELFEFMLPSHVRADLDDETFIELALDESLTALPWEIMFDGEQFLSHKHALGRFITLGQTLPTGLKPRRLPSEIEDLKVLVVGVSRPAPALDGTIFDQLPAVRPEVQEIVATLQDVGVTTQVLLDDDATYDNVRDALRGEHHIVHYTGHASFDPDQPSSSSLLLFDQPLTTGALMVSFSEHPALLCFVNGCETSRPDQEADDGTATWENRYDNYGLARSFLETGTYLLGSRWRLEDGAAKTFARSFYEHLLGEGQPVGKAVCAARRATAAAGDPTCAWASYIYYGDPRIGIRPVPADEPPVPVARSARGFPATRSWAPPGGDPGGPGAGPDQGPQAAAPSVPTDQDGRTLGRLRELAHDYEATRADLAPGSARTQQMTDIASRATSLAQEQGVASSLRELYDESDGGRVVALAQVRAAPDPEHLAMVRSSITGSRSAFEQYVALEVAVDVVDHLDDQQTEQLRQGLQEVSEREDFFGTDRYAIAAWILNVIALRSDPRGAVTLA